MSKDYLLFHVVTYKKLHIGDKIEFGKTPNYFSDRINSLNFAIGQMDLNEFVLKNDLKNLSIDDYKEIKRYIYESCLITREYALEYVRQNFFKNRPSRFRCLFASETLEQAKEWSKNLMRMNKLNGLKPLQIVKIKANGKIFKGESALMLRNTYSMDNKKQMAKEYWKKKTKFIEPEILVEGQIEVIEIIKEF